MSPTSEHRPTLAELERGLPFAERHIGPRPGDLARMLEVLGVDSLDALAARALVPAARASHAFE